MSGDLGEPLVLELSHISKRFGDRTVLDDVSLAVRRGTLHALLGENGAGKTTLMRIAFGLLRPDEGTLTIGGQRNIASPRDAIAAGIGMVHQHFTNVAEMTVAENVALGKSGRFDAAVAKHDVAAIAERSGLALDADARAADLSVGGQQRLEIVKALSRDARILILDEPTAVLAPGESLELLNWLRRFADDGNAVVLITHKLNEALSVADEVTVLRRGKLVLQSHADGLAADRLAAALLGENPELREERGVGVTTDRIVVSAIDVDALSDENRGVRGLNLEIRGGEVVGVAAIEGSGQYQLLRVLARRLAIKRGELRLPASIGFVPEDRHRDAVILPFSLEENVALKGSGARRGRLFVREIHDRTNTLISDFDVRGGDARTPMRTLSGGNQQRLVLGRELDGAPELLVVENPTRGLDLRATRAVHDRLRAAVASGAAVVVYSSDVDEVLALATRVIVIHNGRAREASRDRTVVGRAMLGIAEQAR